MHRSTGLRRRGLQRVHYRSSIDRETSSIRAVRLLPQRILKGAHDAFIDVLGDETTAVGHNVGVSPSSVAKVAESSCIFATSYAFELVSLVHV